MQVLLADDNDVLRRALKGLLIAEGFVVIADVGDAVSLVEHALHVRPDVVSMDLSMPGVRLPDTIHDLARLAPVVVFSGLDARDPRILAARRAGASSIVSKQRSPDELISELRAVLTLPTGADASLSHREREIIEQLAKGLDNNQVGEHFGIGVGTVRSHVRIAMKKLRAKDRSALFERLGLVVRDPRAR